MRYYKFFKCGLIVISGTLLLSAALWAAENLPAPETYLLRPEESAKIKKTLDDPTDLLVTRPFKSFLPPEIFDIVSFDPKETEKETIEILGFRSTDLVGKIAPEVKPGKYTYKDVEQNPGLKELFPPEFLQHHIKAGGPPICLNIAEFEIVPTMQFPWPPQLIEATKRNLGKTELDNDGYLVPRSWKGGIAFPKPSGKFKAQQVLYNFKNTFTNFDNCFDVAGEVMGLDRNLYLDCYRMLEVNCIRLMGRFLFPPYGWLDERAERNGEKLSWSVSLLEPRALRGMVSLQTQYDDIDKPDIFMLYVPSLRRIRKMSATDTQDPQGDLTYDDNNFLSQKITPRKFPYKFDIIAEREYLMPENINNGAVWVDSKEGYLLRNCQFMRRPCYVLQMTQMDPNYIYSKRVYYIDKETFRTLWMVFYDQKGQMYRSQFFVDCYISELGQCTAYGHPGWNIDYVDLHSTLVRPIPVPAVFTREQFSMEQLIKKGK